MCPACRCMWLQGGFKFIMARCGYYAKSCFIAESLYRFCICPDSGKRFRETGCVSPASSLKCKVARSAFERATNVPNRKKYFTLAACRHAIELLILKDGAQPPSMAALPHNMWVEQQAKQILHLCQRARKNCGSAFRFPAYRQSCSMDWLETLEYEARL